MLTYDLLTDTQQNCIDHLYEGDGTLLVAPMGGGKTVCSLTAAAELLREGLLKRVLVIAPLKVCENVWSGEHDKWQHLNHLKVALALGDQQARKEALNSDADIVVINFDNLIWLFRDLHQKYVSCFDGLIIDEGTKLMQTGSAQFKAIRHKLKYFRWRVNMTGTPVSENWLGLFGQMFIVDSGKTLGTNRDRYKKQYFYSTDYDERNWELHPWSAGEISNKIRHSVYTLPDYRDELPSISYEPCPIKPPAELTALYLEMINTGVIEVNGVEVVAESAAVNSGKRHQLSNGFIYLQDADGEPTGEWLDISRFRVDWLLGEIDKSDGPVVVCYWFKADLARILEGLDSGVAYKVLADDTDAVRAWNSREIDILFLHPRSAGHGLDLPRGGHEILWYGPQWSRDLWEQTNARLWRRGQPDPVRVRYGVAAGLIDELIVARVENKAEYERLFLKHFPAAK